MSHFAFGMVVHAPNISTTDEEALAWKIVENGVKYHVYVKLRANIYVREFLDLLWESDLADGPHIDFQITASPLDNTSNGLVRPTNIEKNNTNMAHTSLENVSDWINSLIVVEDVSKVFLYVTESFDVSYKIVKSKSNDILKVLKRQLGSVENVLPFVMEVD
jgi:hypothetical protein